MAYLAFLVLIMVDAEKFFGFAAGENIDIVNVATNSAQAQRVFFDKLKARMRSKCFLRFNPKILKGAIEFPHSSLRLFSLHAQNESWEGFNILAWVMDEASAFRTSGGEDNASAIFATLESSAKSRFMVTRWIGVIISFARRQEGDFTLMKYEEAQSDPTMFADRGATWDINPQFDSEHPLYRNFPFVAIPDLNIAVPEPYVKDFQGNGLTDALTKYLCQPPPNESGFFEFPAKLSEVVRVDEFPIVATPSVTVRQVMDPMGNTIEKRYRQLLVDNFPPPIKGGIYFLHGDPGLNNDAFSLALGHRSPESRKITGEDGQERTVHKVVCDFILTWIPGPGDPRRRPGRRGVS